MKFSIVLDNNLIGYERILPKIRSYFLVLPLLNLCVYPFYRFSTRTPFNSNGFVSSPQKKTNKLVEPVKNRCSTNMTRKQQIKIDSTYQFVNITKIYAKKVHTMIGWLAGWEYVSKCKKMLSVTIKKKRIKIPALLCKALWELLSRSQYTDFASTKKKENNKKASLFIQSEEYVKITSFSLKHGLTEQQQNTAFSLQQP